MHEILTKAKIIPVIQLPNAHCIIPLAEALLEAGIDTLEITLRTQCALQAIETLAKSNLPCHIAAGTLTSTQHCNDVKNAGVDFAVSPGTNVAMLQQAQSISLPLIPGIATATEALTAIEQNCHILKFFPANLYGGTKMLANFNSFFPSTHFIPTGGITTANASEYYQQANVLAIGGSWLTPIKLIEEEKWPEITKIATEALSLLSH